MADIGSWWVHGFSATPGESVTASFYTNYLREDARPLGGKLYVTSERLLFCPHRIDQFFGGDRAEFALDAIANVECVTPDTNAKYGGGPSERLRIEFVGEREAIFVLSDLENAVQAIDDAAMRAIEGSNTER